MDEWLNVFDADIIVLHLWISDQPKMHIRKGFPYWNGLNLVK
jgi:hypothetical protein